MRTAGSLAVASLTGLLAAAAPAKDYSYADLLRKMTDLADLAVLPEPGEKCYQFSSYDRASKTPEDPKGWNANADFGKYLRKDGDEHVMADAEGPGCLVRIWSANPAGVLKIYIDGAAEPAVAAPVRPITVKSWQNADRTPVPGGTQDAWVFPEPIGTAGVLSAFCGRRGSGWNLYFPIPFQKRLKVTVSGAEKPERLYYHVNIQSYPAGTKLPSWSLDVVKQNAPLVNEIFEALSKPAESVALAGGEAQSLTLLPQERFEHTLYGPAAVTLATAKVTAPDLAKALRQIVLRVTFDGAAAPQVWTPLGDFFGSMPGCNLYRSLPLGITKDGMYSRWYMPFKESARIELVNEGPQQVSILGSLRAEPIGWSDGLGHFHAKWRRTAKTEEFDWPFIEAKGRGRVVGVAMGIFNPQRGWWGEGDEKVWIDGESFPSTFGTGSEDYFGYAWGSTALFQHAYHNQTLCEGPENANNTALNRWHILDNLPFLRSIRFTIENWPLGNRIGRDFCAVTYWYAAPGGEDFFAPVPLADRAPRAASRPFRFPGVIEGEEMPIVAGGDAGMQDTSGHKGQWSNNAHLWWRPKAVGAKLVLGFDAPEEGVYKVSALMTKSWDYGILRISINGTAAAENFDGFSGEPGRCVPSGPIVLGVFPLVKGRNTLALEVVGKHAASPGYYAGLDGIFLGR